MGARAQAGSAAAAGSSRPAFELESDPAAEPPVLYARDPEAESAADAVREFSGTTGRRNQFTFLSIAGWWAASYASLAM